MEFCTVLDAPAATTSRIQIAKLGNFEHGRYGKFAITEQQVASWKDNLAKLPGGQAPIDLDHSPERGRGTEAAGWITGIDIEDGKPMADVEWTPLGKAALDEKRYRFISPTYGKPKDEAGNQLGETLFAAGLTNRPHLNMPAISLSSEFDKWLDRSYALSVDFEELESPDSRPAMELSADILKTLGIEDEDAQKTILDLASEEKPDEKKVLAAIEAAKPEPETPSETKTLEQLASESGKVILDADAHKTLVAGAKDGVDAKKQLDTQTFDHAFTKALDDGKAVAADREFYEGLPLATAVKRLADAPKVLNTKPIGENLSEEEVAQLDISDAQKLDLEAQKLMEADDKLDYIKALNKAEAKTGISQDGISAREFGGGSVRVR